MSKDLNSQEYPNETDFSMYTLTSDVEQNMFEVIMLGLKYLDILNKNKKLPNNEETSRMLKAFHLETLDDLEKYLLHLAK